MRVKCVCGSTRFIIHTPPRDTIPGLRVVFLICDNCRRIWKLKDGVLLEVDDGGVLKNTAIVDDPGQQMSEAAPGTQPSKTMFFANDVDLRAHMSAWHEGSE